MNFVQAIDQFLLFLATERGLSTNYQLSTRRSLESFADWLKKKHSILSPVDVRLPVISSFLAHEKERGLAAASLKLVAVAIKIFFRFLKSRSILAQDPAELLPLPRLTHRLPETLNPADIE
ncbi:MAG: site-specific integrase, partial [Verrucomicrobia bacterium]|nr:site-specific integrase [Verrucomicrobiota bacterium]